MITISEFLSKLEGVKSRGSYSIAKCPAHDDNKASLSISQGDDGRILLKCHAGCLFSDIVARVGVDAKDTLPGNVSKMIDREYDYHDENGNLLYQVVRYIPKDFRQRRKVDGEWVYNLRRVRRVLYRLPSVISAAAEGRLVAIVEGEKDSDALVRGGIVATCNAMGAGKWSDDFAPSLDGAHVAIIPDNDIPGMEHAERIAVSLARRGKTKSIRLITLPGAREKGDVSDWLADGHTISELRNIIRSTAEYEFEEQSTPSEAPLYDLESEMGALCMALKSDNNMFALMKTAEEMDFHHDKTRLVFQAMRSLRNAQRTVTINSITEELDRSGKLREIGGAAVVNDVLTYLPASESLESCLEIVKNCAYRRRVKSTSLALAQSIQRSDAPTEAVRNAVHELRRLNDLSAPESHFWDELQRARLLWADQYHNPFRHPQWRLGKIGGKLGPFDGDTLTVIAGGPGVGKTAFMLQEADYQATCGHKTMYFSLEMSKARVARRLIRYKEQFDPKYYTTENNQRLDEIEARYRNLPLMICTNQEMSDIETKIVNTWARDGVRMVFIDYLGIIKMKGSGRMSPNERISKITGELKALTLELGIDIIVGAQFNRDARKQKREPELHDLRDSGSIEQDADNVLLLDRPNEWNKDAPDQLFTVNIAKARDESKGKLGFKWDKYTGLITEEYGYE